MAKLNSVLLIDDDHVTNVYHTVIIKRSQITENVVTLEFPEIALDHLNKACKTSGQGGFQQYNIPDLILLDFNMPRMTGWEFLVEYQKIHQKLQAKTVVFMLTAALEPSDKEKYLSFDFVKGVLIKPLTTNILHDIANKYFNGH